jgi:hypothetical protein
MIVRAFKQYLDFLNMNGRDAKGFGRLEANLCLAITAGREKMWSFHASLSRGWPININFARLPERVFAMKDKLDKLVSDADARMTDIVWKTFVDDAKAAKTSMRALGKKKSTSYKLFNASRPG